LQKTNPFHTSGVWSYGPILEPFNIQNKYETIFDKNGDDLNMTFFAISTDGIIIDIITKEDFKVDKEYYDIHGNVYKVVSTDKHYQTGLLGNKIIKYRMYVIKEQ